MTQGVTTISTITSIGSIGYSYYENGAYEAAKSTVILALFTATPYTITALSLFPGIGQAATGILIALNLYSTISNAQSLCLEHEKQDTTVNDICSIFGYNDFSGKTIGESANAEL